MRTNDEEWLRAQIAIIDKDISDKRRTLEDIEEQTRYLRQRAGLEQRTLWDMEDHRVRLLMSMVSGHERGVSPRTTGEKDDKKALVPMTAQTLTDLLPSEPVAQGFQSTLTLVTGNERVPVPLGEVSGAAVPHGTAGDASRTERSDDDGDADLSIYGVGLIEKVAALKPSRKRFANLESLADGTAPKGFASAVREVAHRSIARAGHPLDRKEILSEVEMSGVPLPVRNAHIKVSKILTRDPDLVNDPRHGYSLTTTGLRRQLEEVRAEVASFGRNEEDQTAEPRPA